MNENRFEGRVALITGGASGIGEACVYALANDGAKVAVADLNKDLGGNVVAKVKQSGGEAIFLQVDVSNPVAVEKMVADTVKAFGRLDISVNNAVIGGELNPTGSYASRLA